MNETFDEFDAKLLLGRYRIVRKLGQGGMGTVHLARLEGADGFTKPVVVKRMRADIKSTDEGNRLFKREAKILSKMQHPGIVNIIDFGVEEGAHIMVLEYVHGYTLAPWLDYRYHKNRPLPVDVCLHIVRKVLDALHYAHHFEIEDGQILQVVHRDVAPDNVLISKKGYVHLLDFGVASMSGLGRGTSTQSGVFRGKLGYAAPETVNGRPATARSDLYSAAVLLLELLTQETPFLSDSMGETIQRMVTEVPPSPSAFRSDIPAGLDEVLAKALQKEPEDRYESAHVFSRELRKLQIFDDDELAQKLRELAQEDFDSMPDEVEVEALKLREEALGRVFPPGHRPTPTSFTGADQNATWMDLSAKTGVGTAFQSSAPEEHKSLRRLLLGLLVVGAVIALALGAAVALLSRGSSGEPVVVVGGDSRPSAPSAFASPPDSQAARGDDVPGASPQAAEEALKSKGVDSAVGAHAATAPSAAANRQTILARAVQSRSSSYQACYAAELGGGAGAQNAMLHFSVSAEGGQATVRIGPAAVASSSLGSCLKSAAQQVVFPIMKTPVSFSVPVNARVTSN